MSGTHGAADPRFQPVQAAFEALAAADPSGMAVTVYHHGRKVVDLFGGLADVTEGIPWRQDTVACVFSVSKAVMALCAYLVAQQGRLDLDWPVSRVWPEFAANSKQSITVRDVLSHRAGLIALDQDLTGDDVQQWFPVTAALEAQRPLWAPGTRFGYHALTYGWLIGEVLRRATGKTAGELVRTLLGVPLDLDLWLGAPDDVLDRRAHLEPGSSRDPQEMTPELAASAQQFSRPVVQRSLTLGGAFPVDLFSQSGGLNDPAMLRAEVPAAGMVATAESLARLFARAAVPASSGGLLEGPALDDALTVRSAGDFWGGACSAHARFSSGFMLDGIPERPLLSQASFGHDGALGELAFADRRHQIGFAFMCNRSLDLPDRRANVLVDALRTSLHA